MLIIGHKTAEADRTSASALLMRKKKKPHNLHYVVNHGEKRGKTGKKGPVSADTGPKKRLKLKFLNLYGHKRPCFQLLHIVTMQ